MAKYEERIKVMGLRKVGLSIGEIAKKVGVAKSTVSLWCRDIQLSDAQIQTLVQRDADGAYLGRLRAAENRRTERIGRMDRLMEVGREKVGKLSKRDLFIAGLALYWAEGNKKNRRVDFCNSDPKMIKLWLSWLGDCMGITSDQVTCRIGINEIHKHRIAEVEDYWIRETSLKASQFRCPSYKKAKNKKVYENFSDHYGTFAIRMKRGTNLNYEILGMIESLGRGF